MNQTTADKIKTRFFEKLDAELKMKDFPRRKAYMWLSEIINSLVSEPCKLKWQDNDGEWHDLVSEPVEDENPWEALGKGIDKILERERADKVIAKRVLQQYRDTGRTTLVGFDKWLDNKPYDPHEVAQMKEEIGIVNNEDGQ